MYFIDHTQNIQEQTWALLLKYPLANYGQTLVSPTRRRV